LSLPSSSAMRWISNFCAPEEDRRPATHRLIPLEK
jgi:hypothetical protein